MDHGGAPPRGVLSPATLSAGGGGAIRVGHRSGCGFLRMRWATPAPEHQGMSQPMTSARPATGEATLGAMVLAATDRHRGPALRFRRDGRTVEWTYSDLGARVRGLARGLAALGIVPGDRVCVLGSTRPEWTLADCAILAAGATSVPIYHTNSPEECRYVLEHSGARAVICEDAGQLAKVDAVRAHCPGLEHVISMVPAAGVP